MEGKGHGSPLAGYPRSPGAPWGQAAVASWTSHHGRMGAKLADTGGCLAGLPSRFSPN